MATTEEDFYLQDEDRFCPRSEREYEVADHELSEEEIREKFGWLIDQFIAAVKQDERYICAIAYEARMRIYKQGVWDVRNEVTRAEKEARRRCDVDHRHTEQFNCTNTSVCGFGHCPYAKEGHTVSTTPTERKGVLTRTRPRPSDSPEYRIEDAMDTLMKLRGITPP